jgi:hypothetical protein
MLMKRTQGRTGCGLVRACLTASGMASQMPGSQLRKTLTLLGLIVLIIHCRPWSYMLFEPACEGACDMEPVYRVEPAVADFTQEQVHRTDGIAA